MSENKLCILPFLHISAKTTGTYRLCCNSGESNILPRSKMGKVEILEIWNSEFYKDVRSKMLNNQEINYCYVCYDQEKLGKESMRLRSNKYWKSVLGQDAFEQLLENSKIKKGHVDEKPKSYDLRLGNKCNLKCRSCNSLNSSTYAAEWEKLIQTNPELKIKFLEESHAAIDYIKDWYESDFFWNDFKQQIQSIKRLYLTGGEPTLITFNSKLIDLLIQNKMFDVDIYINTNLTNIESDLINKLTMFKNINVGCSIDGVGRVNEYIRYPSKWNVSEKNFRKLIDNNINVNISHTLSALNFFEIGHFINWVSSDEKYSNVIIEWNLVEVPHHLVVMVIPVELRRSYLEDLIATVSKTNFSKTDNWLRFLQVVPIFLQDNCQESRLDEFITHTRALDTHRKQKYVDWIPSLDWIDKCQ